MKSICNFGYAQTKSGGAHFPDVKGLLRYIQYRDDRDDHIPGGGGPDRWVDNGLGGNWQEILRTARQLQGKKVLLIGCDPKSDTTSLLFGGKACPTIIETSTKKKLAGEEVQIGDVCFKRGGVFAMELGGPEVGRGCGGRGIIHGFELLEKLGFHDWDFDYVLLDFLGDVVCGGFGLPIARGKTIDRERFRQLLDEYYALHEWDENGVPRQETLERLELAVVDGEDDQIFEVDDPIRTISSKIGGSNI